MATFDWHTANQRYLMAALSRVRDRLQGRSTESGVFAEAEAALGNPAALERLCRLFDLSGFERDLLLICAGIELDGAFASLCAAAQGDPQATYPTFGLALAVLDEPHWSAITPSAPLRRWQLIEVGSGRALTTSPLRIDERVLHYLAGVQHTDERLMHLIHPIDHTDEPVPTHGQLAEKLASLWSRTAPDRAQLPIVQLCGDELAGKLAIAAAACRLLGWNLNLLPGHALPVGSTDLAELLRLWEREVLLSRSALIVECAELDSSTDPAREQALVRFIEETNGPLVVASRERRRCGRRTLVNFDVTAPTADEQRILWQRHLGAAALGLNGQVERLVSHFSLNAPAIEAACSEVLGSKDEEIGTALWEVSRRQARPRLDDLAQRIEARAGWADLVLPEAQRATLLSIAAHVRRRARVYEQWGFAGQGTRGLGISALFAGASGTGKTMAAEVVAVELNLDLYRIDLSAVVSKYIGETEKNLRRVFDAAEAGGVILLFDEADALFGKRSEVKDSHDRYANMEVSYLLQRMEAYRGLSVLTTNLKDAIDSAFLRRIRFVVRFAFPDATQRAEIWQKVFPSRTPISGLDVQKLSRLNVAGGNIRNIALNAAFLAADEDEPVQMKHLLAAARSEYVKLERTLTDHEVKGWV